MDTPRPLSNGIFSQVLQFTPLISIDLIIRDATRRILVGLRTNDPAKGYYFVPGGVIRKSESIERAFLRILSTETGFRAAFGDARFVGVYEHFYSTNVFGDPGYGTHYVVLAYELQLDHRPTVVLDRQHDDFKWIGESELAAAANVHDYTKEYFRCARR